MDCRIKSGNDDAMIRSRYASSAPEFCEQSRQASKRSGRSRFVDETTLFDSLPALQGSGAPKGALSYQFPRIARLRVAFQQRARLSALTLAALATGYYPDGSAPEPGFPRRAAKRAFLPLRQQKVPRLSTLRADRSLCRSTGDPKPPGSGSAKKSARGHRTSHSLLRHAVPEGDYAVLDW